MLPDGVTHTKGYVKNPDEAQRYLSLTTGDPYAQNKDLDELQVTDMPEERKKTDLTKNVVNFHFFFSFEQVTNLLLVL